MVIKKFFIPICLPREKGCQYFLEKIKLKNTQKENPKKFITEIFARNPNKDKFVANNLSLLLGKEQNFQENDFRINFSKEYGANLLISGKNKKEKQYILNLIALNLENNNYIENIYYINNDSDMHTKLSKFHMDIFEDKIEDNSVILIDSLDIYVGTYGLNIPQKLIDVIESGYKNNIAVIFFIDNIIRIKSKIKNILDMFNYRLAFSLNKTELEIFLGVESQVNAMLKAPINYHGS